MTKKRKRKSKTRHINTIIRSAVRGIKWPKGN